MSDEDGEQGDVLWQNPVRLDGGGESNVVRPVKRVARIVRHKVTETRNGPAFRDDEIHVELFGRDARGRSRWEDADDRESVAILKAALASAHQVLDAHREDERKLRDRMIEALPRRRIVTASNPHVRPEDRADWTDPVTPPPWLTPEPEPAPLSLEVDAPSPLDRCTKEIEGHAFVCSRSAGHLGACDPDIPF